MPIRASHVIWPKMNLDYGFLFEIRSIEELLDYWLKVRKRQTCEGLSDYLKSRGFTQGVLEDKVPGGTPHCATRMGSVLAVMMQGEMMKDGRRSVIDVLSAFEDRVLSCMTKVLEKEGKIFVNDNGGYFALISGQEAKDTVELEKWILPGKKPRIIQWANGKHYYAKVGEEDIVVDGEQKWPTYEAAQRAVEQYMKEQER